MRILVPTDFSENAKRAVKFAAEICLQHQYGLHLMHCYTARSSGFDENELTEEMEHSDILKADITIKEWVDELQEAYPQLDISYRNERGLLSDVIPKEGKQAHYAAIVMGTTGASARKNIFWGSNTALITAKSPIPVIAVPNADFNTNAKQIGLLTNFKEEELITLKEFLNIFHAPSDLHLIHVYKEQNDISAVNSKIESWIFNIEEATSITDITALTSPIIKEDENLDTVPEVITKIIQDNGLDLILVSKSRKSFFERLFTSSVSKAMALELHTPAFFGKTV
ncbi:universal stress protein [Sphingobacterium wenxiniae]|uniref:Nucleotide-binding universal stress protein, UspA family n=1 Tax=Sphingobacterium wenxiniae TaxID=683125 RepID=A0A1I6VZI8_9SPHI|nr:universal stress protein [Sphingobacterium wenxiniae]SFT18951.1 Nucleotide-binding universal stress protein, UspA family [Sphingobacterium wenxiniae]